MYKVFFSLFLFFLTAIFGTLELQIGADWGGQFSFSQGIHVRNDTLIYISVSIRLNDHQSLQAGTSPGVESNETNQTGAGDVITSRSREKL